MSSEQTPLEAVVEAMQVGRAALMARAVATAQTASDAAVMAEERVILAVNATTAAIEEAAGEMTQVKAAVAALMVEVNAARAAEDAAAEAEAEAAAAAAAAKAPRWNRKRPVSDSRDGESSSGDADGPVEKKSRAEARATLTGHGRMTDLFHNGRRLFKEWDDVRVAFSYAVRNDASAAAAMNLDDPSETPEEFPGFVLEMRRVNFDNAVRFDLTSPLVHSPLDDDDRRDPDCLVFEFPLSEHIPACKKYYDALDALAAATVRT